MNLLGKYRDRVNNLLIEIWNAGNLNKNKIIFFFFLNLHNFFPINIQLDCRNDILRETVEKIKKKKKKKLRKQKALMSLGWIYYFFSILYFAGFSFKFSSRLTSFWRKKRIECLPVNYRVFNLGPFGGLSLHLAEVLFFFFSFSSPFFFNDR